MDTATGATAVIINHNGGFAIFPMRITSGMVTIKHSHKAGLRALLTRNLPPASPILEIMLFGRSMFSQFIYLLNAELLLYQDVGYFVILLQKTDFPPFSVMNNESLSQKCECIIPRLYNNAVILSKRKPNS